MARPGDSDPLLAALPALPDGVTRVLYFDTVSILDREALEGRGYTCQLLMAMPSNSEDDRRKVVQGFFQGVTDGTIQPTKDRVKTVESAARALGMFTDKNAEDKPNAANHDDVMAVIDEIRKRSGSSLRTTTLVRENDLLEKLGMTGPIVESKPVGTAIHKTKKETN